MHAFDQLVRTGRSTGVMCSRGGARRLAPLAMGLGVLLGAAVSLPGCDDAEPTAGGPQVHAPAAGDAESATAAPPRAYDEDEARAAVETLSDRFAGALEQDADVRPFIEPARRIVQRYPDYPPARTMMAQILLVNEEPAAAYDELAAALDVEPRQPEVHLLAGTLAMQLERLEDAERHYAQAMELAPTQTRPRLHLAQLYAETQRHDDARRMLLEALRLDSSLHKAHAMLADLYARQGQVDLALDQIDRALALVPADKPKVTTAYTRKQAALLRRDNQPGAALSVLLTLPPKTQFDPAVMADLARSWAMLGQPERAAGHYEQALIYDPTYETAAAGAAHWYLEADRPDDARRMMQRLQRINPRHPKLPELRAALSAAAAVE